MGALALTSLRLAVGGGNGKRSVVVDEHAHALPSPSRVGGPEGLPPQPVHRKIKVLHIITRFAGGSGGNTLLSAIGMDPERFETWIVGGEGSELWRRAEAMGVHTVRTQRLRERVAPVDDAVVLLQLFRLIRRERFSVVHTHCAKAGFLGRLAAWLAGAPVIVHTFHAFATHPFMGRAKRIWFGALERAVRPLADRYVAVSPLVAREAVEKQLAEPGNVEVVLSAIDMDAIPSVPDATVRRELGVPADSPIVGWVGRMVYQKAPLDFVRMAALVRRTHPQVTFVMVGDASHESRPLERATRREAARLGVDVVFTGFRPDAPRIASAFDVFVISSLYEGLGRGLTEALASGRAVVATAVNGVPDLVVPGTTGLLAEAQSPDALAEGVRWLLDHPEEARQMGARARHHVRELFDPRTMCVALDRLYSQLLCVPAIDGRGHEHEA